MQLHNIKLNSHKLFNLVYHKGYIEVNGQMPYSVKDTIWLKSFENNTTSEGFLTIHKIKYDKVNDITFIDFKKDRCIERKKSLLQKIKDFLRGY